MVLLRRLRGEEPERIGTHMKPQVFIVKISHGFDRVEWNCAKHIAEHRKRGADVKVGDLVAWPCDRCLEVAK